MYRATEHSTRYTYDRSKLYSLMCGTVASIVRVFFLVNFLLFAVDDGVGGGDGDGRNGVVVVVSEI